MATTGPSPRFSVIVPTFNRAETVVETVITLDEQSFGDFEIVVVDDGSTDETASAVEAISSDRLSYRWQPNAGPSVARNTGAELAGGEYIVFLDTGDRPRPGWLTGFDEMIRAYGCSVVSCGADFTRQDTLVRSVLPCRTGPGAGYIVAFIRAGCFAVRRDLFWEVGGFDPVLRFSEMSELGMRLGQRLSGETNATAHLTSSLVSIELPPSEGRGGRAVSFAYSDQRRLETAEYILAKHQAVMAAAPGLRQTYLRIAGVAAARLGDFSRARGFFIAAWRARPHDVHELSRAATTLVPGLRGRVWPPLA